MFIVLDGMFVILPFLQIQKWCAMDLIYKTNYAIFARAPFYNIIGNTFFITALEKRHQI